MKKLLLSILLLSLVSPTICFAQRSQMYILRLVHDLESDSPSSKRHALRELRIYKPKSDAALSAIVETLADQESDIRESAANLLISIGDASNRYLIKGLKNKDEQIRAYSAAILSVIGTKDAIPNLIKNLKDQYPEVRVNAAAALRNIPSPESIQALNNYYTRAQQIDRETPALSFEENIDSYQKAKILLERGIAYLKLEDFQAASDSFEQSIAAKRDNIAAYFGLGQAKRMLGQYKEAEKAYRYYVRFQPNDAEAQLFYGKTLLKLGKEKEAQRAFKKVLSIDPNRKISELDALTDQLP